MKAMVTVDKIKHTVEGEKDERGETVITVDGTPFGHIVKNYKDAWYAVITNDDLFTDDDAINHEAIGHASNTCRTLDEMLEEVVKSYLILTANK